MYKSHTLLAAIFLATLTSAQSTAVPAHFKNVAEIVGKQGTHNADGSYRINIPRTDIKFTNANGMQIPADLGLATYIAMTGNSKSVFAVGDVAMIESEIDPVIDRLRAGGFEIVSLHNHMASEDPRLFFLHFQAFGSPQQLADTFRTAIEILGKPVEVSLVTNDPKPELDAEDLREIMGVKAQVFASGVLRFAYPRKDISVGVGDYKFLPGMGLASWVAFHACDCGQTMVMGDTCCTRKDLQKVIDEMRAGGISITAIHNHILGATQEVVFLHFEGEGDSTALAKTIKSCWDVLGK